MCHSFQLPHSRLITSRDHVLSQTTGLMIVAYWSSSVHDLSGCTHCMAMRVRYEQSTESDDLPGLLIDDIGPSLCHESALLTNEGTQ